MSRQINKTEEPSPLLIPAVIYTRYSSSGQREESIEGQLRDFHEFAQRSSFVIVGDYIDKALTGRTGKHKNTIEVASAPTLQ